MVQKSEHEMLLLKPPVDSLKFRSTLIKVMATCCILCPKQKLCSTLIGVMTHPDTNKVKGPMHRQPVLPLLCTSAVRKHYFSASDNTKPWEPIVTVLVLSTTAFTAFQSKKLPYMSSGASYPWAQQDGHLHNCKDYYILFSQHYSQSIQKKIPHQGSQSPMSFARL